MYIMIGAQIQFTVWLTLRLAILIVEIFPSVMIPNAFYATSGWMLRILLLATAATTAFYAGILLFMGIAWEGGLSPDGWRFYLGGGSVIAYFLSAIVLNFPGFPLETHLKRFFPCQLLLLPLLVFLQDPLYTLKVAAAAGIYIFLWWLCLQDRSKSCLPTFKN